MQFTVPVPRPSGDEAADAAAFAAWELAQERFYYPGRFAPDGSRVLEFPDPEEAMIGSRWGRVTGPNFYTAPGRKLCYYLGAPEPSWLNHSPVPLFVSASRLARYRSDEEKWPVTPGCSYAMDSGAYIALTGSNEDVPWFLNADVYGGMITRFVLNNGWPPDFVAPQDWPCEPTVRAITGFTVRQHQEFTLANYLHLVENFPFVNWIPVLQGWEAEDYLIHEQMYLDAGVDLAGAYRVGIGSICRRGHIPEIVEVVRQFAERGYQLHGFGIKTTALPIIGHLLASADSMAWSDTARKDNIRLPECEHTSRTGALNDCRNCFRWALTWRERVLNTIRPQPKTEEAAVPESIKWRVTPGQLWSEVRNVDTSEFRTVRWFVVVAVDGDQVTTVDVDHDTWEWRPELRTWGVGDIPRVELTGPYGFTTVESLQHPHFAPPLAAPENVGCVLPGDVPAASGEPTERLALYGPPLKEHDPRCWLDPRHHAKTPCSWPADTALNAPVHQPEPRDEEVAGVMAATQDKQSTEEMIVPPPGSTFYCTGRGCGRKVKVTKAGKIGSHCWSGRDRCKMSGQPAPQVLKSRVTLPAEQEMIAELADFFSAFMADTATPAAVAEPEPTAEEKMLAKVAREAPKLPVTYRDGRPEVLVTAVAVGTYGRVTGLDKDRNPITVEGYVAEAEPLSGGYGGWSRETVIVVEMEDEPGRTADYGETTLVQTGPDARITVLDPPEGKPAGENAPWLRMPTEHQILAARDVLGLSVEVYAGPHNELWRVEGCDEKICGEVASWLFAGRMYGEWEGRARPVFDQRRIDEAIAAGRYRPAAALDARLMLVAPGLVKAAEGDSHVRGTVRMPYDAQGMGPAGSIVPAWVCCSCGGVEVTEYTLRLNHGCCTGAARSMCSIVPPNDRFKAHWTPPAEPVTAVPQAAGMVEATAEPTPATAASTSVEVHVAGVPVIHRNALWPQRCQWGWTCTATHVGCNAMMWNSPTGVPSVAAARAAWFAHAAEHDGFTPSWPDDLVPVESAQELARIEKVLAKKDTGRGAKVARVEVSPAPVRNEWWNDSAKAWRRAGLLARRGDAMVLQVPSGAAHAWNVVQLLIEQGGVPRDSIQVYEVDGFKDEGLTSTVLNDDDWLQFLLDKVGTPLQGRHGSVRSRELADRYAAGLPLVRHNRKLSQQWTFVCPVPSCQGMYDGYETVRALRAGWFEHALGDDHGGFTPAWDDEAYPVEPEPGVVAEPERKLPKTPRRPKHRKPTIMEIFDPPVDDPWWKETIADWMAYDEVHDWSYPSSEKWPAGVKTLKVRMSFSVAQTEAYAKVLCSITGLPEDRISVYRAACAPEPAAEMPKAVVVAPVEAEPEVQESLFELADLDLDVFDDIVAAANAGSQPQPDFDLADLDLDVFDAVVAAAVPVEVNRHDLRREASEVLGTCTADTPKQLLAWAAGATRCWHAQNLVDWWVSGDGGQLYGGIEGGDSSVDGRWIEHHRTKGLTVCVRGQEPIVKVAWKQVGELVKKDKLPAAMVERVEAAQQARRAWLKHPEEQFHEPNTPEWVAAGDRRRAIEVECEDSAAAVWAYVKPMV